MAALPEKRLLIAGEVLFDCFPGQRRVLGGAPFNVAWNLRGLGHDPLVLSAIGDDDLGREVTQSMRCWQLDRSALQIHPTKPTGRVDVVLDQGEPTYTFWQDVAFDHLQPFDLSKHDIGLFYQGSLALRAPQSAQTITALRQQVTCPVFVDINVRQPYFQPQWIDTIARGADHLKLNADEFQMFLEYLQLPAGEACLGDRQLDWGVVADRARQLQTRLEIGSLWLTAAEQGAACLLPGGDFFHRAAPPVIDLQDTVGAGDAFSAVVLHGLMTGWEAQRTLELAVGFAARVCGLSGATSTDHDFYRLF